MTLPRSGGMNPKDGSGAKSTPQDLPASSSKTSSADEKSAFPVTAERYSTLWEDEVDTRDLMEMFERLKAKQAAKKA